jgi:cobalt-zinc-cadmium efflux system protein
MARGHAHHGHAHAHLDGAGARRSLGIALGLNAVYTAGEAVAGFLTGSLALLADAGHNLSDVAALGIALWASWLAARPPTARHSFGYKRAEILAALANALLLVVVSVLVFVEAARRFADPPDVPGGWMLVVAAIGVAVNLGGAAVVYRRDGVDLNLRASFVHLAGDAASSAGVIAAGLIVLTTGWLYADPLFSVLIGVVLVLSAVGIIRDAVLVLLESTPRDVDAEEVGRRMAGVPGVVEVHDLHIWTITSGFPALAAHVLVREEEDCHARRRSLEELLRSEFGITHTTLQVDHAGAGRVVWTGRELGAAGPGRASGEEPAASG